MPNCVHVSLESLDQSLAKFMQGCSNPTVTFSISHIAEDMKQPEFFCPETGSENLLTGFRSSQTVFEPSS
jgi:hypothetical protein